MRAWIAAAALFACAACGPGVAPAEPARLTPAQFANEVGAGDGLHPFIINGLVFRDGILFVGTNAGLLEIRGGALAQFDRWHMQHSGIRRAWRDDANGSSWFHRLADQSFVRLDRSGWSLIDLPAPPDGSFYTRGQIGWGFDVVSDSTGTWLAGAGSVWMRTASGSWTLQPGPALATGEDLVWFASLGADQVYVVPVGQCFSWDWKLCRYAAYWRTADGWKAPISLPLRGSLDFGAGYILAASNAVYLRSDSGDLVRVAKDTAVSVEIPGICDVITRASDGSLLAAFRSVGISAMEHQWRKLLDYPEPLEGEPAVLAESRGTVALATNYLSVVSFAGRPRFRRNDQLWPSTGGKWRQVELVY